MRTRAAGGEAEADPAGGADGDPVAREEHRPVGLDLKTDADRHRATIEAGLHAGTYIDPSAGQTTVAEYAEQWLPSPTPRR